MSGIPSNPGERDSTIPNASGGFISSKLMRMQRYERFSIARYMDDPGYIPILGTAVGGVRIVSSIAIGILSLVAVPFCGIAYGMQVLLGRDKTGNGATKVLTCLSATHRSMSEAQRGVNELFCLTYFIDKNLNKEELQQKKISDTLAHGKYYYKTPSNIGSYVYSRDAYEGEAEFVEGDEYEVAYALINRCKKCDEK